MPALLRAIDYNIIFALNQAFSRDFKRIFRTVRKLFIVLTPIPERKAAILPSVERVKLTLRSKSRNGESEREEVG